MNPGEQAAQFRSTLLEGEDRGPSYGVVDPVLY